MKAPAENTFFFCSKESTLGLIVVFRGPLPVALSCAANGSNHSTFLLHLQTLLHVVAGTPVPKWLVGRLKKH